MSTYGTRPCWATSLAHKKTVQANCQVFQSNNLYYSSSLPSIFSLAFARRYFGQREKRETKHTMDKNPLALSSPLQTYSEMSNAERHGCWKRSQQEHVFFINVWTTYMYLSFKGMRQVYAVSCTHACLRVWSCSFNTFHVLFTEGKTFEAENERLLRKRKYLPWHMQLDWWLNWEKSQRELIFF